MDLYAHTIDYDTIYRINHLFTTIDDSVHCTPLSYLTVSDTVACDTTTTHYTPILSTTQELPIVELPHTPAANSWVVTLIILAFVFFALSYRRGAKYLQHQFSSLFKVNARGNMFDETTINENQLRLSLLTLTFITEGITIYYALLHNNITEGRLILPAIAMCSAVCAVYYILQRIVYNMLALIFSNKATAQIFDDSFITVNLFIGLLLSPTILVMIFMPQASMIAVYTSLILYILARLLIIYKGISIFLPHLYGLLYLILYLCALEVTPIILIRKIVTYLYKILELNLITPWK